MGDWEYWNGHEVPAQTICTAFSTPILTHMLQKVKGDLPNPSPSSWMGSSQLPWDKPPLVPHISRYAFPEVAYPAPTQAC